MTLSRRADERYLRSRERAAMIAKRAWSLHEAPVLDPLEHELDA
jgi:hypothetical protein